MKIKYLIMIAGVGGTGGNFAKEFCRYISCLPNEKKNNISIVFVDGDIVEEKNISRQPFISQDINLGKAAVLADAVNDNFELNVSYVDTYLDSVEDISIIFDTMRPKYAYNCKIIPIIVGCVDNHRCRQLFHEYFNQESTCVYIDSANEYSVGEVVSGTKLDGKILSHPRAFYYPEVLHDTSPSKKEESCGTVNESSPQHIVTNMLAANILLSEVVKLISDDILPQGIVYFDAFKNFAKKRCDSNEIY